MDTYCDKAKCTASCHEGTNLQGTSCSKWCQKTRALLDHAVQVSLVHKELLPLIKEKNQWSISQCDNRSLKMDGQLIGTGVKL